jgi:hypothetical protein
MEAKVQEANNEGEIAQYTEEHVFWIDTMGGRGRPCAHIIGGTAEYFPASRCGSAPRSSQLGYMISEKDGG